MLSTRVKFNIKSNLHCYFLTCPLEGSLCVRTNHHMWNHSANWYQNMFTVFLFFFFFFFISFTCINKFHKLYQSDVFTSRTTGPKMQQQSLHDCHHVKLIWRLWYAYSSNSEEFLIRQENDKTACESWITQKACAVDTFWCILVTEVLLKTERDSNLARCCNRR